MLIDGTLSVIDHGHELESRGAFIRNSSRENNPRVILAFSSGITVYIENAAAVLQMAVVVPVQFKGRCTLQVQCCLPANKQRLLVMLLYEVLSSLLFFLHS